MKFDKIQLTVLFITIAMVVAIFFSMDSNPEKEFAVRKFEAVDETTTVILTIPPSNETVYIIEEIPKTVAKHIDEVEFNIQPLVIDEDPLIIWRLTPSTEPTELRYTVKKNIENVKFEFKIPYLNKEPDVICDQVNLEEYQEKAASKRFQAKVGKWIVLTEDDVTYADTIEEKYDLQNFCRGEYLHTCETAIYYTYSEEAQKRIDCAIFGKDNKPKVVYYLDENRIYPAWDRSKSTAKKQEGMIRIEKRHESRETAFEKVIDLQDEIAYILGAKIPKRADPHPAHRAIKGVEAYADGSTGVLTDFYWIIKLDPVSETIRFKDSILTIDDSTTFQYGNTTGTYSVEFLQKAYNSKEDELQKGDIVQLHFTTQIGSNEQVTLSFIPKIGTTTTIKFTTPEIKTDKVYLWP